MTQPVDVAMRATSEQAERLSSNLSSSLSNTLPFDDDEVTEQRVARIQAQQAELERLAVAGEMTANLAHEIKTPLNALAINVQLIDRILRKPTDADASKALELLQAQRAQIQRLNELVEQTLAMSRRIPQQVESDVSVNRVVSEAVECVAPQAATGEINLEVALDEALPHVHGNQGKLRQVLVNLLINAIQATPAQGTVRVITSTITSTDGEIIQIAVVDNGCGVETRDLEQIFRPFFTTKPNGTGLGLAICDRIIRSMNGTIAVQSRRGIETIFTVTLPAERRSCV